MNKYVWRNVIAFAVLILFLILIFSGALEVIGGQLLSALVHRGEDQPRQPDEGTYFCEELQMELVFEKSTIYLWKNGVRREAGIVGRGSFTLTTVPEADAADYMARYSWDRKADCITLRFINAPDDIPLKTAFQFVRIIDETFFGLTGVTKRLDL